MMRTELLVKDQNANLTNLLNVMGPVIAALYMKLHKEISFHVGDQCVEEEKSYLPQVSVKLAQIMKFC